MRISFSRCPLILNSIFLSFRHSSYLFRSVCVVVVDGESFDAPMECRLDRPLFDLNGSVAAVVSTLLEVLKDLRHFGHRHRHHFPIAESLLYGSK